MKLDITTQISFGFLIINYIHVYYFILLFYFILDGYNSCEFKDEDDCIFYFTYNYDVNNELKIIAQRGKGMSIKVQRYLLYVVNESCRQHKDKEGRLVVVIVWQLNWKLPMQSVPITTKVMRSNPAHGGVYSIQHYVTNLSVTCGVSVISGYSGFLHQ